MVRAMKLPMAAATSSFLFVAFFSLTLQPTAEAQVGVCYGSAGDNFPSAQDTINLLKSKGIGAMRLYEPHPDILQAAQGSSISFILGDHNDQVKIQANDPNAATQWVQTNVRPFASSIKYVVVGNEVSMSDMETAPFVGPAMQNMLNAINAAGLGGQIKVTTAIKTDLLQVNYPPSQAKFGYPGFINPVLKFLRDNGSPLLANVYTYFAYENGEQPLSYALSNDVGQPAFVDNGLPYTSLFDAQVDALRNAVSLGVGFDAAGNSGGEVDILVSESGWSSAGGRRKAKSWSNSEMSNAETYYRNLIKRTKEGTPRKRGPMEIYLFALYDEDHKPGSEDEHHFGLFTPDRQPKYNLQFN